VLFILAWAVCLGLLVPPVLFLLAPLGTDPHTESTRDFYKPLVAVLGNPTARVVFCLTWIAFDLAIIWRYLIRREDPGPPLDD
jgi:hypothetical protein